MKQAMEDLVQQAVRHLQQGQLDAAELLAQQLSKAQQGVGFSLLAAIARQQQQLSKALIFLDEGLRLLPKDQELRNNHTQLCHELANQQLQQGNWQAAIPLLRQLAHQQPDNQFVRVNLTDCLARTGAPAELADIAPDLTEQQLQPLLFVACMPKSGSTLVARMLSQASGYAIRHGVDAYVQNEQDLRPQRVREAALQGGVMQHHTRASDPNIQVLQAFAVKPLVLVRNLFDIVASLKDFWDSGAVYNGFFHDNYLLADDSGRYDLLIDLVLPWYLSFYASWQRVEQQQRLPIHWLRYESLIHDPEAAFSEVQDFYQLNLSHEQQQQTLALMQQKNAQTRFNQARIGRGRELLNTGQQQRIERLCQHLSPLPLAPLLNTER